MVFNMKSTFPTLLSWLCVAAGGALGAMLRFGISYFWPSEPPFSFPYTTLLINMMGCFIAGLAFALLEKYQLRDTSAYLLLITGFCGGFTTFSAFSLEGLQLLQHGQLGNFIGYAVGTVLCCMVAVALGWIIIR
jgi:CrcB protein